MNMFADTDVPQKIPTGIEGFEEISIGGIPEGRSTMVVGSSGTGKTIFCAELLYRGITQYDRPGVFITFEERPVDIVRNVRKLGWDLGELVEQKKLVFIDASPRPAAEEEEAGPFDLLGLISQIEYQVKQVGAKLVVLDSIAALFYQYQNTGIIRREIFRITDTLKGMGLTSILTAERLSEHGKISRYGIEEFVSDNVIVLRNVLSHERCRRTIQILKIRGDSHHQGEFPFTISKSGISMLPLSSAKLQQSSSTDRISFGNKSLDSMTSGGLFRDSIILVSGPTGSGKTLMCTTFTAEACSHNEKVLMLAYEESREQLLRNAQGWGLDFQKWEDAGLLKVLCLYPESMGPEDHLLMIRREIEAFQPRRLIMDSISAMERVVAFRNFREFVIGLTAYAKEKEICSLFTSTTPRLSGGDSVTEAHISTITDAIILLRYVEVNGVLRRGVAVIKMRGSQHEKVVREFTIDDTGLQIGEPFKNIQNIILGVPTSSGPSESDQLGEMFD